jgi:MFS family permease
MHRVGVHAAAAHSAPADAADNATCRKADAPTPPAPVRWMRLHVLYVVSFLDLMAVSMIIPSLASYVKGMQGGAVAFGYIMSMYGLIQFFSAPIAGGLSDVYGRYAILLVSPDAPFWPFTLSCLAAAAFCSRALSARPRGT